MLHKDVGRAISKTEWTSGDTHRLGGQATGDLIAVNASGVLARLPVGIESQTLKMVGGTPTWVSGS